MPKVEFLPNEFKGKRIKNIEFDKEIIRIYFENDERALRIHDNNSCCEERYFTIDDDLMSLIGEKLMSIVVVDIANDCENFQYSEHAIAFMKIQTNRDHVTVACHNEHNGYYGGFNITIIIEDPPCEHVFDTSRWLMHSTSPSCFYKAFICKKCGKYELKKDDNQRIGANFFDSRNYSFDTYISFVMTNKEK